MPNLPLNMDFPKEQMDFPKEQMGLRAPAKAMAVLELRAIWDVIRMWPTLLKPATFANPDARRSIIVLPGFGASDRATWPLRHYLKKQGHHVEGWGLGINRGGFDVKHKFSDLPTKWASCKPANGYRGEGSVGLLCERIITRLKQRAREESLTLIGWSLGGVIAREVARELPDLVEQVITLGTPVRGGPKYTAAAPYFRKRGVDLEWIEREVLLREQIPMRVPTTAIVSPSDGIVGYTAALDHQKPNVEHIEIDAAHLGLCANPDVWRILQGVLVKRPAR